MNMNKISLVHLQEERGLLTYIDGTSLPYVSLKTTGECVRGGGEAHGGVKSGQDMTAETVKARPPCRAHL